jgi:hypothetical protein
MLIADRMTPPRCSARAVATVIPAAAHSDTARPPDTPDTYRPPGRFRPGGFRVDRARRRFEAADAFLGRLRYARRSASLGGVDSLAAADAAAACT